MSSHCRAARPDKVLFVTAGSGITPVMGMLRSVLPELSDVVVVHSARTQADVVFGSELRALAAGGRIRLIERHTRADGRLKPAELAELVPDLAGGETWACGPNEMLDDLETALGRSGPGRAPAHRTVPAHRDRLRRRGGTVTFARSGTVAESPRRRAAAGGR